VTFKDSSYLSIRDGAVSVDDCILKETEKEAWKIQAPYSLLIASERTEHQESAEPHG
jgi:hypothetical protein